MQIPSFTLFVGPMFGGKTTKLLTEIDRLKYQKKNVCLFKPMIDDRYDASNVVSHVGLKHDAIPVKCGDDIIKDLLNKSDNVDVIAVDEAFMIQGCADALKYLFSLGKSIIVASIDLNASCKPLVEITSMMPYATSITKCPAVCVECGNDAYYTYRSIDDDAEILIGGAELYEAVCFNHHPSIAAL